MKVRGIKKSKISNLQQVGTRVKEHMRKVMAVGKGANCQIPDLLRNCHGHQTPRVVTDRENERSTFKIQKEVSTDGKVAVVMGDRYLTQLRPGQRQTAQIFKLARNGN